MRKDAFKDKLYKEFQQDLYWVLNATIDDYLRLHASRGEDPITRFDKLYAERGPAAVRSEMQSSILFLRVVMDETRLGREMSWDEISTLGAELGLATQ